MSTPFASGTILVTGGAGFIGSAVVRFLITETDCSVVNVDKLTYAGNLSSLDPVAHHARHCLERTDICDADAVAKIFEVHRPDAVMHMAAESHVDRSIDSSVDFMQTNIMGTHTLLEAALRYWRQLDEDGQRRFRFHHISTDEVYGSLGPTGLFSETTPYQPNSPYSASKAASDHLVRAWHHTYGLPVVITNCSNNYGPYQFPEKLIPLMIIRGFRGQSLPIYGAGQNVRDWLYVDDHVRALWTVLHRGRLGEVYNIGGRTEKTNRDVVDGVCALLDELLPDSPHVPHAHLIEFVPDRPGHDMRYAMDITKIERELGWIPAESFDSGLRKTVEWYLTHQDWWRPILEETYRGERLGAGMAAQGSGE